MNKAADTLRTLAQDNERLKERIRELEAERDWQAKRSDDLQTYANAIREKTIEECAKVVWQAVKAIGALDRADETKENERLREVVW
jgi:DNA replication initiation complex subunit (GINS family)